MKRPHLINLDPIDDDAPKGRVLSRREALRLFGISGAALLAGTSLVRVVMAQGATAEATAAVTPSCVVKPEMTEGPYFVDEMLNRSDIRIEPSDGSIKEGKLLNLIINVMDVTGGACAPLVGAQVDVWHCDAIGTYSDVSGVTEGLKFLRGYQITDENGTAKFVTIYPGWYQGRTIHIHFKIRTEPNAEAGYEFTSQLFFDDATSDAVYKEAPYTEHTGRDTYNNGDNIYTGGGDQMLLPIVINDDGSYTATFDLGLDLSDAEVGASDSAGGMGGGAPGNGGRPGGQPPNGGRG